MTHLSDEETRLREKVYATPGRHTLLKRRTALDLLDEVNTLRAKVTAVAAIHYDGNDGLYPGSPPFCAECTSPHDDPVALPCPTLRALAGTDKRRGK